MKKLLFAIFLVSVVPPAAGPTFADDLHLFVKGSWTSILNAHKGHPFVVHIWGVTCGPCRTEMPVWGELRHERTDLDVVMINADLVPDSPTDTAKFLSDSGLAGVESWLFTNQFQERLRYEINPDWQGEIPATIFIDKTGKTDWVDGSVDKTQVAAWLNSQKAAD